MPSNYTGNPVATQAPSGAPTLGQYPIGALPLDSDTPNVSSIYQAFKVCLDWIAKLSQWGATVTAEIAAAIAAAVATSSLTTQVAVAGGSAGSVSGQALAKSGSRKEITFSATVSYSDPSITVNLSGTAYLAANVRSVQATIQGGTGTWQNGRAHAYLASSDATNTVITVVCSGLTITETAEVVSVSVVGGW